MSHYNEIQYMKKSAPYLYMGRYSRGILRVWPSRLQLEPSQCCWGIVPNTSSASLPSATVILKIKPNAIIQVSVVTVRKLFSEFPLPILCHKTVAINGKWLQIEDSNANSDSFWKFCLTYRLTKYNFVHNRLFLKKLLGLPLNLFPTGFLSVLLP